MIDKVTMKNTAMLLPMLIAAGLVFSSCEDATPYNGEAIVEIELHDDNGRKDITGAEVLLNCRTATGDALPEIVAVPTPEGHYKAVLTAGCSPGQPFIEVCLDNVTYHYTSSELRFEKGQRYKYSLKLDEDTVSFPGSIIIIDDWGSVDAEVSF